MVRLGATSASSMRSAGINLISALYFHLAQFGKMIFHHNEYL